jgi:hypothetical protein
MLLASSFAGSPPVALWVNAAGFTQRGVAGAMLRTIKLGAPALCERTGPFNLQSGGPYI